MSFIDFYNFYLENKDKINMPADQVGIHPPNMEALQRWRDKIEALEYSDEGENIYAAYEDPESIKKVYLLFADAFIHILSKQYITFTQYKKQIQLVAKELFTNLLEGNYKKIHFVIAGEIEKSNTWVALLFLEEFLQMEGFKERFLYNPQTISTFTENSKTDPETASNIRLVTQKNDALFELTSDKTMFLHFDDMSYSGGQMGESIRNLWKDAEQRLGVIPGRPKGRSSSAIGAGAASQGMVYDFEYYVATPYIAKQALLKFRSISTIQGVKIPKNTIRVPRFEEQLFEYYEGLTPTQKEMYGDKKFIYRWISSMCDDKSFYMSEVKKPKDLTSYQQPSEWRAVENSYRNKAPVAKGIWAFRCIGLKPLIYFDHKLADEISTFQKTLYFGSYPVTNGEECIQESLITGCAPAPELLEWMKSQDLNSCRNYIKSPGAKRWNLNQKYICPPTFYKTIVYTLYGVELPRNQAFTVISKKLLNTKSNTYTQQKKDFIKDGKEFFQSKSVTTGGRRQSKMKNTRKIKAKRTKTYKH